MAGSAMSVHTRVVRTRRRADSRAATEPRLGATEAVNQTTPYRRDFSPEVEDRSAAQRDSLPYCELEVVAERQDSQPGNVAAPSLDGPTERDLPPPPELFAESSDVWTVKHEKVDKVETSKVSTANVSPSNASPANVSPANVSPANVSPANVSPANAQRKPAGRVSLSWLGVVVAQPEVGAPLVIGTWLSPEFRVTSPVTRIIERSDGVLVQTATKSHYFVRPAGDAYLVGIKR